MSQFFFISGLPRSGSTLFSALLRQNPNHHAGITSPIAGLFENLIAQVSAGSEIASMVDTDTRVRLLRGLFDTYYSTTAEPVIFDTNRSWTAKLPALLEVYPETKIICMVRNVAWIIDSMERQFRQNPFEFTRLFTSPAERSTVYTRAEALAAPNRLVGFPWQALREACYSEHADKLMILEYDLLVARPKDVMKLVSEFLGQEPYEYDFDAVEFDAPEFDNQLGVSGLHRVHPKVEARTRRTILPPDLFKRYDNLAFWQDLTDTNVFRITAEAPEQTQSEELPDPKA